jgi:hypothetical protein
MALVRLASTASLSLALRLQLLGLGIDLFGKCPQLFALGTVFLLQVGEVALAFIGLRHSRLERNDGNLHGTGRRGGGGQCLGGSAQSQA